MQKMNHELQGAITKLNLENITIKNPSNISTRLEEEKKKMNKKKKLTLELTRKKK